MSRMPRRAVLAAPGLGAALPAAAQDRNRAPPIVNLERLEDQARAVLPREVHDWIAGGAGSEAGVRRNREALLAATLTPRVLTGAGPAELALDLLGVRLPRPIIVGPFGLHGLMHPGAEAATARGAAEAGVLMVAPMVATRSMEETAQAAPGAPRWLQLYILGDRGVTRDLIARAEAAGYGALVITLSAPVAAWRERDIANGFIAPDAQGSGNRRPHYGRGLMSATDDRLAWRDIAWLRGQTRLPLVLKGILHPADAARAVAEGAGAVFVSNHGGRQLESAPAGFSVLPRIAETVAGSVPLILDGGIRRGEDVVKAVAAGATAIAVARPVAFALALGGAEGVRAVVTRLGDEVSTAMRLVGAARLADLTSAVLERP